MAGSGWTTIESDPGVFTELIQRLGTKGVQVEELFALDSESLHVLKPVYGLVFLFKWKDEMETRPVLETYDPSRLFFAQQMISNACATQAILSILLNHPELDLGEHLTELRTFCQALPPDMRGLAMANSTKIRDVHNSFARPEPFVTETRKAEEDDDVFHFIAYVPVDGVLYELDGLKPGPIVLVDHVTDENWVDEVLPHVQARVGQYQASEMRFNLMAIVQDRKQKYEQEIQALEEERRRMTTKRQKTEATAPSTSTAKPDQGQSSAAPATTPAESGGTPAPQSSSDTAGMEIDQPATNTAGAPTPSTSQAAATTAAATDAEPQEVASAKEEQKTPDSKDNDVEMDPERLVQIEQQLAILHDLARSEAEKMERWKQENIRRKHNYIPFIVNFIKILADRGELSSLVDEALDEQQRKAEERRNAQANKPK